MGIEYKHWLLPSGLSWIGDQEVAGRVHDVLEEWGLVAEAPKLYSLDGGRKKKIRGTPGQLTNAPANLLVEYSKQQSAGIGEIMGPSYYDDVDAADRYFQVIALIIGTDYRLFMGGEAVGAIVLEPPNLGGKPVKPYAAMLPHSSDVYPATSDTEPPLTSFLVNSEKWPVPKGFQGIFRSGLALDCGKDLPAIVEKTNVLPSRKFFAAMQKAFGTKLVQIGLWY